MPRTQRDNIFIQAAFQKSVWDLALQVMNRCQMGQLKSQKLNRKHLISTPEFKQHLLQLLHHLDPQFQQSILQKIVDQEVSLSEMKKEASEFRSMCVIKSTFMRLISCHSWDEAKEVSCIYFCRATFTVYLIGLQTCGSWSFSYILSSRSWQHSNR